MSWIINIGMIAAICTTVSFIPQAVKTIRTKNTTSISSVMYSLFTFGTLMWLVYGCVSGNIPIIIANAITLILAAIILYYKRRYK